MNLSVSLLINAGGLFDFDFTFLAEGILFFILSLVVTFGFLAPISKQLKDRAVTVNYILRKCAILTTFGYENLSNSVALLTQEVIELNRQVKITRAYTNGKFDEQIIFVQKENNRLLSKLKGDLAIKSGFLLANITHELNSLTEKFFKVKFG